MKHVRRNFINAIDIVTLVVFIVTFVQTSSLSSNHTPSNEKRRMNKKKQVNFIHDHYIL